MKLPLKIIYSGWKKSTRFIGRINSTIVLSLIFFSLIGIYGILQKISMYLKRRQEFGGSFWKKKVYVAPTLKNLEKQF